MKTKPRLSFCFSLTFALLVTTSAHGYYNPQTGRWLSRDPMDEKGGANLHMGFNNTPVQFLDVLGLWALDVHYDATKRWAISGRYPDQAAEAIAEADHSVDSGDTRPMPTGNLAYHFNRNLSGGTDSRLERFQTHKDNAERLCTKRTGYDLPRIAARELGRGLHPLQDIVAHGDFGMRMRSTIVVHHNMCSPQWEFGYPGNYPDMPWLDVVGSEDGSPSGRAIRFLTTTSEVDYAIFTPGIRRWKLTKERTESALAAFRAYVRLNGGCECKRYFGVQ